MGSMLFLYFAQLKKLNATWNSVYRKTYCSEMDEHTVTIDDEMSVRVRLLPHIGSIV